ncbi:ABC transporter ATP-binding protein/permease [Flavihumibacter rivuli]|uniref:ABC transporter ATP-binding protein n=1 Tax=Flavihumibacter rivuli TaxID=2838156 RepID=UPI001BDF640D|nr:ABC transporter ATP-binding protein [Flavihumibacter rivuli]ULQ55216.1 ABC transporter ATP-binding protein/permease [Flavihumibacter rivuli]
MSKAFSLVEVQPDKPAGIRHSYQTLFPLVLGLLRPYWKWLLVILLCMLLETAMGLASPWPLKVIIDNVIGNRPLPEWLDWIKDPVGESALGIAAFAAITMIIITAIDGVASYFDSYFTESLAQYMANDLRRKIYHHLQQLSLSYYDTHRVGKLLSTITTDVNTIQDFAASTVLTIIIDGLTIVGMLGLMFYLNWDFSLITIGVAPFLLLFVVRFRKAVKKATHQVRRDQSEMVSIIQNGLESIRTVNAYGRQDLEEERLQKISMETVDAALKARRIKSMISPIVTLTISCCTAFVLWRGAGLVLKDAMTIGSLTVFLSYLNKFFSPVKDLAKMTGTIAQATVAMERIKDILDADQVIPEKEGATTPAGFRGEIKMEAIRFSYREGQPVLKDINLSIAPGQRIGICGPTGGGKSTLAALIPRFYDPQQGSISIDGTNVKNYTLKGLRSQIGFVLQDTLLFYGTIYDNIAYGRPDATQQEIMEAARLGLAHDFIMKLPDGYQTMVGEKGYTLSGGERHRIGIARALVRNAPILILDEPTAALDAESEKVIMEALENLMKRRTVIIISHRLNTITNCDKIIVVNEGRIVEEGKHGELIKRGGLYAELYTLVDNE